ncbi:MAG: MoxR family ATPase [Bacillota bacterium]
MESLDALEAEQLVARTADRMRRVREALGTVVVGHRDVIEQVLLALSAGGHVLLEGLPGLGKTLLVRTLAAATDLAYSRIQFTPDLMPADIVGTNVLVHDPEQGRRTFQFQPGPIFAQVVLADEINRATPKTQSALLEAMQEHRVTVAGVEHRLQEPFFVLATQNPIEMEGTYPLPEAQLDRFFFKVRLGYPDRSELAEIIDRTTGPQQPEVKPVITRSELLEVQRAARMVAVATPVRQAVVELIAATRPDGSPVEAVRRFVRYGASPRGAQAVMLAAKARALLWGRMHVSYEDVEAVLLPALRHRLILNFEGESEGVDTDRLLIEAWEAVRPRESVRGRAG